MTTENPPPRASPESAVNGAHDFLRQVVDALERWGELFLRARRHSPFRTPDP